MSQSLRALSVAALLASFPVVANQPLDLMRPPTGAVPLTRGPLRRGTRQHGVLGRDPSLPAPLLERRDTRLDGSGAMHQRPPHPHQARALGVRVGAALKNGGTKLVGLTTIRA